jgi:hypothetical protein
LVQRELEFYFDELVSGIGSPFSGDLGLHQIPSIAIEIMEDGHNPIRLPSWFCLEHDSAGSHGPVVSPTVIGAKEEKHSPTCLIAYAALLGWSGGPCQEQTGSIEVWRSNQHPPFSASKVCVLDNIESQSLRVEVNCFVIIADNQGD